MQSTARRPWNALAGPANFAQAGRASNATTKSIAPWGGGTIRHQIYKSFVFNVTRGIIVANKKVASFPLSEKAVTDQCISFLRAKGFLCIRMQSGTVRGLTGGSFIKLNPKGTPDWIAIYGCYLTGYTKTLFLEMKRSKGGKLSADQVAWHADAAKKNLAVLVVSDFDQFRREYDALFRANGICDDATVPLDRW